VEVYFTLEQMWFAGEVTAVDTQDGRPRFHVYYDDPPEGQWDWDDIHLAHFVDDERWRYEEAEAPAVEVRQVQQVQQEGSEQRRQQSQQQEKKGEAVQQQVQQQSEGQALEKPQERRRQRSPASPRSVTDKLMSAAVKEKSVRWADMSDDLASSDGEHGGAELASPSETEEDEDTARACPGARERCVLGDVTNKRAPAEVAAQAVEAPLAEAMLGGALAPCLTSAEMAEMAEEQLSAVLQRPPTRMPEGAAAVKYRVMKSALEGTLRTLADKMGVDEKTMVRVIKAVGDARDWSGVVLRVGAVVNLAASMQEVRRAHEALAGDAEWQRICRGASARASGTRGAPADGTAERLRARVQTRREAEREYSEFSDSEEELEAGDDLGVRKHVSRASDRKRRMEGPTYVNYIEAGALAGTRKEGDAAVQANAFQDAARRVANSERQRRALHDLREAAQARSYSGNDGFFQEFSTTVVKHPDLALALLSTEISDPKGERRACGRDYLPRVVGVVRGVQAEVLLAVTQELREILGYDAAVDNLARAIVLGRWRQLDFKDLAAAESVGTWVGKGSAGELPDWTTQLGLFQAVWTPLVCVYVALHAYDASAHRVLTVISTETQNAIRVGMTTADAVAGLVTKFFAMLEEDMRAMQRGATLQRGRNALPRLADLWERCQTKPFYRQFSLQTAASRMPCPSYMDKFNRRLAAIEQQGGGRAQATSWSKAVQSGGGAARAAGAAAGAGAGAAPPAGTAAAGSTTPARPAFIPAAVLAEWQDKNPGKCFMFHLKGTCSSGGAGAACARGKH